MSMIEVKTAELIGPVLDWAVANVEGLQVRIFESPIDGEHVVAVIAHDGIVEDVWFPSTDWSQGGPLLEKHMVGVVLERQGLWVTTPINWTAETVQYATTPLIAACRAIVAAKLGDVVQVPAELIGDAA